MNLGHCRGVLGKVAARRAVVVDAAVGMRLLADLRDVFGAEDKLWTETILAALHGIPEAHLGQLV